MTDAVPQRLHFAAALVRVMSYLPYVLLAVVIGFFGSAEDAAADPVGAFMEVAMYVGLAVLLVAGGIIRWWRFRYWMTDGEFRVLDGVLIRREIFIPFERIRTVEVNEGLWQRIFGVVRLQVKTGAGGTQADLTAISRSEADRLQKALRERAEVEVEGDALVASAQQTVGSQTGDRTDRVPGKQRVISVGELVATGATSGRLGYILAIVAWIVNETAAFTLEPLTKWAQSLPTDETAVTTLVVLGVAASIVGLLLLFLGSVVAAVVKYGQFAVERHGDELTIRHGLINRQTLTLPLRRIQAVRFVQNPVRELMGSGALYVEAIGHAEEKGRSSELFPLIGADELDSFIEEFLPEFVGSPEVTRPPSRALFRFFFAPLVVTLAVVAGLTWYLQPWGALSLLLVPIVAVFRWLSYRQNGVGIDGDVAQVETRSLMSRQVTRLPRRAVRSAESSSNIFQARRNLGNVIFTVASGAGGKAIAAVNLDRDVANTKLDWTPGVPHHAHQGPS